MDMNRLRVFRAVAASGSIRGAAEALDYAPASVSQQVAQLQRETGLTLIRKVGRNIEPTADGAALATRLDDFFTEVADLEGYIAGLRAGRDSTLTLCYFSSLGAAWMPQVLAALTREFPRVRLDLHVRDTFQPEHPLRPDLQLIAHAGTFDTRTAYRATPITTDPYLLATPPGHHLDKPGAPIPLTALRGQAWIDTNAGQGSCRQIPLDACAAAGFRPDLHIQAQDYTTALAMVAAGIGIAVLPRIGTHNAPAGVRLHTLTDPTPVRHITALTTDDHHAHPVIQRALHLIHHTADTESTTPGDGTPHVLTP